MTPLQVRVLDWVREMIAQAEISPSIRDIADQFGIGVANAHACVAELVRVGALAKGPEKVRNLRLPDQPDLRLVASDVLAAELARRGVTLASLERREPRATGRQVTCAADTCGAAVQRGHLMCRTHWFGLPSTLRERILRTNSRARSTRLPEDARAFERAVTEARDLIDSGAWRRAS